MNPTRSLLGVLLLVALAPAVRAADGVRTPLTVGDLDAAAFAEWVDGAERTIEPKDAKDNSRKPTWVVWTDKSAPGHAGLAFGPSKAPGPRHLRVGFAKPVAVGAVLVRGGVRVSVLKATAKYPGDLADDAQWEPAERVKDGKPSRDEGARENYRLWTLPAVVQTRAVRFTHVADVTEKDYAGWVGGAYVLPSRLANLAPQATPAVSSNERSAAKLVDEHTNPVWEQWANLPTGTSGDRAAVVSPASPEWAILTWAAPVKLRGLGVAFAGFAEAEVEAYAGPADVHPREAGASAWKPVGKFAGLKVGYPVALPVDWLDFGQDVTTRALRVRMTAPMPPGGHPHVANHSRGGKRVWAGEFIALSPLADGAELKQAIVPKAGESERPPIAVRFTLPEAGWVTLVIEDAAGKRVRNLVADTFFEKGENVAWWDGSDDLGRDPSAAKHGLYYIPTQFVAPGAYKVRGLWRKRVDVKYEFGVYAAGATPWETADRTGGWLSNHTPPQAVLFVPDAPTADGKTKPTMLIGSYVSEGTAGLAWVDLDGKKWRGQGWVGGNWTGAPYLARDAGPKAVAGTYAYVAAAWSAGDNKAKPPKGEIRLTALTAKEDKAILRFPFDPTPGGDGDSLWTRQIGGLAVYNGVAVISMPAAGKLLLVDVAAGKVTAEQAVGTPFGVAFDSRGRLLVTTLHEITRYQPIADPNRFPEADRSLGPVGFDELAGITLDAGDNIYVSERGAGHQVYVFDPQGKPLRTVGKPGRPLAGPYDPLHMNNPRGLAVDPQGRLWVAEQDEHPKRVSVWNPDGSLARAFYGPAEYGGGGSLDPVDKTKLYYAGMEFKLDWAKGTDQLAAVFYRPGKDALKLPFRSGVPQNAVYAGGRRYWINSHNSNPTGGHGSTFVFADRDGVAVPCAGFGRANDWDLLKEPQFAGVWPKDTDPKANPHTDKAALFLWQDLNADGQVQPDELKLRRGTCGGVLVQADLSFVVSRLGEQSVRLAPTGFTPQGVPTYDAAKIQELVDGAGKPPSSGGDQALAGPDGWTIHTTAPKPFSPAGIGGARNGTPLWSYPSLWPGLHASHEAPVPDRPGMIVGHTRLLGDLVRPTGADPMFFLNANDGPVHVFTYDGLYVAQLFQDMRVGKPWMMPSAPRGMVLNELTPSDENFWPNVTQTADGEVYLTAGRPNALVKVEGLDSVRRLPDAPLTVSADDLTKAHDYFARAEAARQAAQGRSTLAVGIRKAAPKVDGKLDEWASADWADVDRRGTRAYFNSNAEPYNVTAAVAVAGDRLYAAWRSKDKDLLKNAGDVPNAPFKTGGALDLMVGSSDAGANDKRQAAVPGDVRLLVTQVNGKPRALVYRPAVAAGQEKRPVPFASPWRTISFDRVDDVSGQVELATDGEGNYEVSVPLAAIGLKAEAGKSVRGDVGILRGTGSTTTQRVYWSNKSTAIVADVPSEAELRPGLWGRWEFKVEK